ncbi:MAG: response regulator [Bacteroidales bacterium]
MIYIIDDDQYVRRGFGILLKSAGFESSSYGSSEEFMEKCSPVPTDLVLLDYHLPGMSGGELMEYFQSVNLNIPVIIVTAYDDQSSRDAAKKYGAIAYLRKPVDGEALIDLVKYSTTAV